MDERTSRTASSTGNRRRDDLLDVLAASAEYLSRRLRWSAVLICAWLVSLSVYLLVGGIEAAASRWVFVCTYAVMWLCLWVLTDHFFRVRRELRLLREHESKIALPREAPHSVSIPRDPDREVFKVYAYADRVFGDVGKAERWMSNHNELLSARPADLVGTLEGRERVLEELARIEHGIFA